MGQYTHKLQLSILLSFLALSAWGVELEPKTIRDFKAGLNTLQDSSAIPDNAAQDLSNVDVYTGRIEKRRGTLKANSTALTGNQAIRKGHEYIASNGTFYLLTVSSNTIFYSSDGGATNTVGTSTHGITSTTRFQTINALGNAYFISSTTNAIVFNGSAFTQNTSIPLGSAAAFFAGRIWVANGSTLYGSRVSSDTDWTDDGVDDADAFSAVVRSQDGYSITALVPFGPDLLVFKSYSVDRLVLNNDGLTFSLVPVISHIGTNYPEAIQSEDNEVVWLAHDGVYAYNGAEIKRISENIQPTIASLAQLSAASRSYTETTQANFALGTSTGVSTSITPDSVVLSTWTAIDTSTTDFSGGTLSSTRLLSPGSVILSTSDTNISVNDFESAGTWSYGSSGSVAWLRRTSGISDGCTITAYNGSGWASDSVTSHTTPTLDVSPTLTVTIKNNAGTTLGTTSISITNNCSWSSAQTISLSTYRGKNIQVCFSWPADATSQGALLCSETFYSSGENMTVRGTTTGTSTHSTGYVGVDYLLGGKTSITSGSFTSQIFDTHISSTVWGAGSASVTSNGNTSSFQAQSSPDGSVFSSLVAWTPGTAPSLTSNRYFRYKWNISLSTSSSALPFLDSVTAEGKAKSGRYISQSFSTSGGSTFLPFTANGFVNGGSLTYEVYTDTDTNITVQNGVPLASSFTSSQTITTGGTPTISIGNYARVGSTFSITAATQNPQLDDFTLAWGEGNVSLYPASLFWDQAYYLSLAVNSATQNDTIFIFDRNGAWTKYEGLPAFSMFKYRTNPYFGAADEGSIVRMQVNDRYRDYKENITTATWSSKDFDFGFPLTVKTLVRYYITGQYETGGNVTFSYGVERGALTGATYPLTLTPGFFHKSLSPTSLTYSEGIQHRFQFYDNTLDGPMSILSITGRYNLQTNP